VKRRKVGDRDGLIDKLWSAIEMWLDPEPQSEAKRTSKQDEVIAMLRRPEGVTVDEVASVMGLAAPHCARRLLGNPEKEARAHPRLGPGGARLGVPHR
jgi:hypothetical protein